ncbi:unnamed protein product [Dracunculus medinensis]|uniref:Uncharacterized protein n=1 Tax=Dracunculus medinensis TaxID=318479 RepID=A0A0N4UJH7_DRAME|nr:unnamed protein product [Dracunculus medinensis]
MSPKVTSTLGHISRKCASYVPETIVQFSAAKARMSGDPDYQLHRRITTTVTRRDRNHYWSGMALRMEIAARYKN